MHPDASSCECKTCLIHSRIDQSINYLFFGINFQVEKREKKRRKKQGDESESEEEDITEEPEQIESQEYVTQQLIRFDSI